MPPFFNISSAERGRGDRCRDSWGRSTVQLEKGVDLALNYAVVFHLTNDKWLLVLGKSTRLFPYISVAHMDSLQLLEKKKKKLIQFMKILWIKSHFMEDFMVYQ